MSWLYGCMSTPSNPPTRVLWSRETVLRYSQRRKDQAHSVTNRCVDVYGASGQVFRGEEGRETAREGDRGRGEGRGGKRWVGAPVSILIRVQVHLIVSASGEAVRARERAVYMSGVGEHAKWASRPRMAYRGILAVHH